LLVKNNRRRRGRDGPAEIVQTFYGQLHYIIEVTLPRSELINPLSKRRFLLAFVEPCLTNGKDATRELTTYERTSATIFIDLQAIGCIVGRIKRGNEWAIIDRSEELARTVFVDPNTLEEG
jgi:hypothetical protein